MTRDGSCRITGTRTESPRRHTLRSTIMPPKPNSCTGWQTQLMRTATPSSLTAWCAALSRANLLWYKPDGDLNYSYKPDGTCSGQDYPYLTYNDLLELQRLYAARHGQENPAIARLLQVKLTWMNKNGVTGYNK